MSQPGPTLASPQEMISKLAKVANSKEKKDAAEWNEIFKQLPLEEKILLAKQLVAKQVEDNRGKNLLQNTVRDGTQTLPFALVTSILNDMGYPGMDFINACLRAKEEESYEEGKKITTTTSTPEDKKIIDEKIQKFPSEILKILLPLYREQMNVSNNEQKREEQKLKDFIIAVNFKIINSNIPEEMTTDRRNAKIENVTKNHLKTLEKTIIPELKSQASSSTQPSLESDEQITKIMIKTIFAAANSGNVEQMKKLIELGVDVLATNDKGQTPLEIIKDKVTPKEFEDLAKLAKKQIALNVDNPAHQEKVRKIAVDNIAEESLDFIESYKELLKKPKDQIKGEDILKLMELIIDKNEGAGLDFDNPEKFGKTVLNLPGEMKVKAQEINNEDAENVDINKAMEFFSRVDLEARKLLSQHLEKASPKETALHDYVQSNPESNARNSSGEAVAKLIKEQKIDVNQKNPEGLTPLMIAAQNGNEEIASALLNHGADPTRQTTNYERGFFTKLNDARKAIFKNGLLEGFKKIIGGELPKAYNTTPPRTAGEIAEISGQKDIAKEIKDAGVLIQVPGPAQQLESAKLTYDSSQLFRTAPLVAHAFDNSKADPLPKPVPPTSISACIAGLTALKSNGQVQEQAPKQPVASGDKRKDVQLQLGDELKKRNIQKVDNIIDGIVKELSSIENIKPDSLEAVNLCEKIDGKINELKKIPEGSNAGKVIEQLDNLKGGLETKPEKKSALTN